ncbi:hypothetical protein Ddye_003399 [Dipteronia dyeriana]|uniref:Small auxin up regulated protein n=1 Tax=Dipteronia dyeriana TaxID=168575 RepID=A0AAE0CVB4_9ROSI|nr:hypothetical protein Ddye_003399 [Dipteronia dyeriana]
MLPISYMSNQVFQKLLRMSEDEFGLLVNGPITLPCDAVFMEYAVFLIQGCDDRHLQDALVVSIASSSRCSSILSHSLHHGQTNQPFRVCS